MANSAEMPIEWIGRYRWWLRHRFPDHRGRHIRTRLLGERVDDVVGDDEVVARVGVQGEVAADRFGLDQVARFVAVDTHTLVPHQGQGGRDAPVSPATAVSAGHEDRTGHDRIGRRLRRLWLCFRRPDILQLG